MEMLNAFVPGACIETSLDAVRTSAYATLRNCRC
jgi:hypothetical protein